MVVASKNFYASILFAVWQGESAAWLATLLAGLVAFLLLWPVAAVLAARTGGGLIALARTAAGVPGAMATALLISGYVVSHSGLIFRQTTEMTVSAIYPHTPQTVATVALGGCILYGAYGGMAALVRLCRAFLPILVLAILLILAGSFGWGQARFLLPIWGPGPGLLPLRSVTLAGLYTPMLLMLVAAGQLRDRKGLVRAVAVALAGSALLFAATKAVLVMAYPLPLANSITFPLHELSRLVLGGRFFERIEGVWTLVWVFATAAHLSILVHAAAVAMAEGFGMPDSRVAVPPLVTMMLAVALLPPDQTRAIRWHYAIEPARLAVAFGLPLALALLAAWRRRSGSRAA